MTIGTKVDGFDPRHVKFYTLVDLRVFETMSNAEKVAAIDGKLVELRHTMFDELNVEELKKPTPATSKKAAAKKVSK